MSRITAETLMRDHGLPRVLANEIIQTERQRALRAHWPCWTLLLLPALAAGGLILSMKWREYDLVFLMAAAAAAFAAIGLADRYAEPFVRAAAREKANRLAGRYPSAVQAHPRG